METIGIYGPVEGPPMKHRDHERRSVQMAATIEFGGEGATCKVLNMSASGAMLGDVTGSDCIPENVSLVIPTEGKHFSCRVVWRKDKRIGVTFE